MPINNPVLTNPSEGQYSAIESNGGPLASLISRLWTSAAIIGGLLLIIYLIWGAIDWLTAAGDTDKVKKARQKIMDGVMGLALIVASFAIVMFLKWVFGFDLVNITWPTA